MVGDGTSILVDQNDCRTTDLDALRAHGPVDLHWLQYSGAIWYPMVYEMPDDEMRALVRAKVDSQLARAMRYVESVDARAVVPSAGPPCFLDPDLFQLNVIDGDEPIDLLRPARVPRPARRRRPPRHPRRPRHDDRGDAGDIAGRPTRRRRRGRGASSPTRAAYLARYQADWMPWLDELKASWTARRRPTCCRRCRSGGSRCWPWRRRCGRQVGAACLLRAGDVDVLVDFPAGEVRAWTPARPYAFRFDIDRAARRDRRRRAGRRLEQLAVPVVPLPGVAGGRVQRVRLQLLQVAVAERMRRTEAEAVRQLDPGTTRREPDISSAAGSSSAAARTATPTSPCSARSRTARCAAPSTAGASTSTPAAA